MGARTRYLVAALASLAILGVSGVAHAITNNSSSVGFKFSPSTAPKTTFKNGSLFLHTHTTYAHPGNKAQGGFTHQVTLLLDNDFKVTPGTLPKCSGSFSSSTTLKQAWNACGPGAGSSKNAYLSPSSGVSGTVSTAPTSNFPGCVLVFNGPKTASGNPTVVLFARVTLVPNGTANCANPGSNTSGNTSVTLKGTFSTAGVADFGRKLVVPNVDAAPLPLDDFTATIKRGSFISGRCNDANHTWNVRGTFTYSGSGQAADTVNKTQTCTVG